jgi:hypothetical protein
VPDAFTRDILFVARDCENRNKRLEGVGKETGRGKFRGIHTALPILAQLTVTPLPSLQGSHSQERLPYEAEQPQIL